MSLKSSFKKTNLDLTKPPGPNRTNSKNVGSGRYITPKTWNTYGWSFQDQFPGGALKDLDGKLVFKKLSIHNFAVLTSINLPGRTKILASLCLLVNFTISGVKHKHALMPLNLLAEIDIPIPLPQIKTPFFDESFFN